jgi:hypothetical protein
MALSTAPAISSPSQAMTNNDGSKFGSLSQTW